MSISHITSHRKWCGVFWVTTNINLNQFNMTTRYNFEMTANKIHALTEGVFVRYNFEGDWYLLVGRKNEIFLTLKEAQDYLRETAKGITWEISTLEQALMNNGQIDNL